MTVKKCEMCKGFGTLNSPFGSSPCPVCTGRPKAKGSSTQGETRKAPDTKTPKDLENLYEMGCKIYGL